LGGSPEPGSGFAGKHLGWKAFVAPSPESRSPFTNWGNLDQVRASRSPQFVKAAPKVVLLRNDAGACACFRAFGQTGVPWIDPVRKVC